MDHTLRFQRIPGHSPGSVLITLDQGEQPDDSSGEAAPLAEEAEDENRIDVPQVDPAHSDCLKDVSGRVVFTGDYLIYGEEELLRLKGGSPEDYEAIARPVLEEIPKGTWICPGHGPIYRMGD